jgi:hypothetical protein
MFIEADYIKARPTMLNTKMMKKLDISLMISVIIPTRYLVLSNGLKYEIPLKKTMKSPKP